ncbi:chorismate mutase [Pseudomonas mandelii]|uniref:chorismate mutase n=1 Tax=Pseudomonas mandelii TaxID=75612 RepID=UPI00224AEE31|nr:chorismate mutase [Pseudomonas mandelii]MCX2901282.1 chorismate mutase [Pseudomonas mandelii]
MRFCPSLPKLLSVAMLGLFICEAQAAASSPAPDSLQPLLVTMNERLNIADQVALSKWDTRQPTQDTARETQVIANARKQALERKLDPDEVAELIAAQIEASKLVQYGLLAHWQAAGKAPDRPRPDLSTQVRPRLDQLQVRLLNEYSAFARYRTDPNCPAWLATARSRLIKDTLHGQALIRATGDLCITAQ